MRFPSDDKRVASALAVVKKYDPRTYARMDNDSAWVLTSELSALPHVIQDDLTSDDDSNEAFGSTYPVGSANPDLAVTYLNCPYVDLWADHYSVDRDYFAAAILVHEYQHAHQTGITDSHVAEPPAFAAGSAFAAKLPNPSGRKIKALSDETEREFA